MRYRTPSRSWDIFICLSIICDFPQGIFHKLIHFKTVFLQNDNFNQSEGKILWEDNQKSKWVWAKTTFLWSAVKSKNNSSENISGSNGDNNNIKSSHIHSNSHNHGKSHDKHNYNYNVNNKFNNATTTAMTTNTPTAITNTPTTMSITTKLPPLPTWQQSKQLVFSSSSSNSYISEEEDNDRSAPAPMATPSPKHTNNNICRPCPTPQPTTNNSSISEDWNISPITQTTPTTIKFDETRDTRRIRK